jgi:D-beta-D-heptose 7-phosphate kinase / D-beta-D-heptose 1-phosphate adenosyltransferase
MSRLSPILDRFPSQHVLVLGDAILDVYLRGHAQRLCQEAAVPVVDLEERTEVPGGAANTALNLQALGAKVTLLSIVGRDRPGHQLCRLLAANGVDTRYMLAHPQRKTLLKQRIVADGHLVVRMDQGDIHSMALPDQHALAMRLRAVWPDCDAVVVSDYDYGAIGPEVMAELAELSHRRPTILIGDSKRLEQFTDCRFSAIKPNYGQAARLLSAAPLVGPSRLDQVLRLGIRLFDRIDTKIAAVTLDQDGAIVIERGRRPVRTFTEPNPHAQAAGAGDTYIAGMALALASGADVPAAAEIAAAAAAIVVKTDGTSCCSLATLKNRLVGREEIDFGLEQLLPYLDECRKRGQRIVLTNGCFDILHRGHISYLNQARALGDLLVVGLNTDESIRRLKGPERPINSLDDRMQVLAALECVDHVVAFDEDTPHRLVKAIRPNIFVKGGDYTRDRLPEAALVEELGGRVEILPLVRERSTTKLISRIRAAESAAAGPLPVVAPTNSISLPYTRMS